MIMRTPNGESTGHPLSEHPLQEVGPRRRDTLERAGFATLEALAQADPGEMASLQGMYLSLAHRTIARAIDRLEMLRIPEPGARTKDGRPDDDATVEHEVPVEAPNRETSTNASPKPTKKGRKARPPKEIRVLAKALLDRIRRARRHAADAKAKKERRRARAQLERLGERLEQLRARRDLAEVSRTEWARTERLLVAVDTRLERFLDRRPKRLRLEKLAGQAKRAARSLPG